MGMNGDMGMGGPIMQGMIPDGGQGGQTVVGVVPTNATPERVNGVGMMQDFNAGNGMMNMGMSGEYVMQVC